MDSIFGIINNHYVPVGLAIGILSFALIVFIVFRIRVYKINSLLNKAIQDIKDTPTDESEFFHRYQELDDKYNDNKLLKHAWSEFTETLIISEEKEVVRNSHESGYYFNISTLVKPRINTTFYQAFPNKLVGIGLLFTFIGLVAALYFASKGVSSKDIEVAQKALSQLLDAATFKFSTSIAGLLGSLLFSWGEKHTFHKINRKIHLLCTSLDERLEFVTPEKLADEQLQETKIQTEQLERFNTDLAVSIAGALEKPLENALNKEISPLIDAITTMTSKIGGVNENALESMMKDFSENLQGSAGKEMEQLGQTLSGLTSSIGQTTSNLENSMSKVMESLSEQIGNLSNGMNESANHFANTMQGSAQSVDDKLGQTFSLLSQSTNVFTESISKLSTLIDGMNSIVSNTQTLVGDFAEPIRNIKDASQPLASISTQLSKVTDELNESQRIANESISGLNGASENIGKTSEHVMTTLNHYKENFENIDSSTSHVFEEINTGLEAYTSTIKDFVSELDQSFNQALSVLSGAINELNESVEEIGEKVTVVE